MNELKYLPRFDEILRSVFHISTSNGLGTCFICRLNKNQIVVITCKHMFLNNCAGDTVSFKFIHYNNDEFDNFSGILLCFEVCYYDICAIIVDDLEFDCAISFQSFEIPSRVSIGDEIFVLGFPFIMKNKTIQPDLMFVNDIPYPQAMLRHGYVSSTSILDDNSRRILLDLHNNSGFSGSPILKKIYLSNTMDFGYIPIGVISGYYYDEVNGKINDTTNSDISYGCPFNIIACEIMRYEDEHDNKKSK